MPCNNWGAGGGSVSGLKRENHIWGEKGEVCLG